MHLLGHLEGTYIPLRSFFATQFDLFLSTTKLGCEWGLSHQIISPINQDDNMECDPIACFINHFSLLSEVPHVLMRGVSSTGQNC
jgi:hypothetical protein